MTTLYDPTIWQAGVTAQSSDNFNKMEQGIRAAQPIGALLWSFSESEPGYLKLDGATISRTTFEELFDYVVDNELIGSGKPFGSGDGSTTFVLPDFRQRFPRPTPAGASPGDMGGSATHKHQNPSTSSGGSHAHGVPNTSTASAHTHSNPSTSSAGGHTHAFSDATTTSDGSHGHSTGSAGSHSHGTGGPSATATSAAGAGNQYGTSSHTHTTGSGGSHAHSVGSGGGHTHKLTVEATSSDGSHAHAQGNTGSGGGHSHSVGGTDSGGGHTHTQADTVSESNLPPYFNINCFIAT